ncbi:phosphopyruvate hydratase [Patescibacteria group bacterium]
MKHKIQNIFAREILASTGVPTIETEITLENDVKASASVPYGASAGIHEAFILQDKDSKRYNGLGAQKACAVVKDVIGPKLIGMDATDQKKIDQTMLELDGTPNKEKLGGNSILSVSNACARAAALATQTPLYKYIRSTYHLPYKTWKLPRPMMVVIEGGVHADNSTDFQEYLFSVSGAPSVKEAVRWGEEAYQALKKILKEKGLNTNVGNEGAFAPAGIETNEAPLSLLVDAIKKAGYVPGKDISISLDPAASEFYNTDENKYVLKRGDAQLSSDQMIALFKGWIEKYPIISIEDGLAEDDWDGWASFFKASGRDIRIIGDDLIVTKKERVQKAIDMQAINGVLIKLNQIGTLTETIETIQLGRKHDFWQVPSHRGGGETNDTFMMDLGAAVNAEYVKVGPARGERTGKYNRLLFIEEELGLV